MKWFYYGFGAFIGFICGTTIEFIFYLLEQSGNRIISNMIRDYGALGRFVAEIVSNLPYIGLVLGVVMICYLFPEIDSNKNNELKNN
jgi:ABC-type amino acid transport system permease subunit